MPNPDYWGTKPLLAGTEFKFYSSQQPQILALQGGDVDVIGQFVPAGATSLLKNSAYRIIKLKAANHRELSMRCDQAPFTDPRVRQAVAYTLDRQGMVSALLDGYGSVANDYPFGPRFPSTDTSAPPAHPGHLQGQAAAGRSGPFQRFTVTLDTETYEEIPQLAQVIKADAAKAGSTST